MKESNICIEFQDVQFAFADEPGRIILDDLSFNVKKGEILGLLGPNGSGKTTIMNLIAGFLKPNEGKIIYAENGEVFSSMIFQEAALLDWKTVSENIELSLLTNVKDVEARRKRVNEMIKLLKLEDYKEKLPKQLSGGLKQRVAIARALAPNPALLLMDEPFSALDIATKEELIKDIREIIIKEGKSAIFISHNNEEASFFCDRILKLNPRTKKLMMGKVLE